MLLALLILVSPVGATNFPVLGYRPRGISRALGEKPGGGWFGRQSCEDLSGQLRRRMVGKDEEGRLVCVVLLRLFRTGSLCS